MSDEMIATTRGTIYDPDLAPKERAANRARARRLQDWLDARRWERDGRRFLRALEIRGRALLLREAGSAFDPLRGAERASMASPTARPVRR